MPSSAPVAAHARPPFLGCILLETPLGRDTKAADKTAVLWPPVDDAQNPRAIYRCRKAVAFSLCGSVAKGGDTAVATTFVVELGRGPIIGLDDLFLP